MKPVILWRHHDPLDTTEVEAAQKHFPVFTQRSTIPPDSLVIGRYSVLPFYRELELDCQNLGSRLINSFSQHDFIAHAPSWANNCLGGLTPRVWTRLEDLPEQGPFVLKGATNSRKDRWDTMMFAQDKRAAVQVALRLREDSLISSQELCIRPYVPLKRLATGLNGLPITKEFRFFVCNNRVLTGAFYWSSHIDDLEKVPQISEVPQEILQKAILRIGDKATFYALDVAETESGDWIVIEINDGQMSGLSENDPDILYSELRKTLDG